MLTNPCKIASGSLHTPLGGQMFIKMYDDKDKPTDILTYDAKAVLAELKTINMYEANGN